MPWLTLQEIRRENIERERNAAQVAPTECPNDGWPLERRERDGALHCRFDGWVWNGLPAGAGTNPGA